MTTNNTKTEDGTNNVATNVTDGSEQDSGEDNSDTDDIPNTMNNRKRETVKENDIAALQSGNLILLLNSKLSL